jgi:CheY-like chemotaxis protein
MVVNLAADLLVFGVVSGGPYACYTVGNIIAFVIDMTVARILVVDDDKEVLTLTCQMLILRGYEVLPATDSCQALEAVNKNAIDLIVSDNQMPGMQGTDLIREIKQFSPQTACVIMTGSAIKCKRLVNRSF